MQIIAIGGITGERFESIVVDLDRLGTASHRPNPATTFQRDIHGSPPDAAACTDDENRPLRHGRPRLCS
jgi:hypothetical protein